MLLPWILLLVALVALGGLTLLLLRERGMVRHRVEPPLQNQQEGEIPFPQPVTRPHAESPQTPPRRPLTRYPAGSDRDPYVAATLEESLREPEGRP